MQKVLIVEGDLLKATALRRGLAAEGYSVLWAQDTQTGIRLAAEGEVDLVVLGSWTSGSGEQNMYEQLKGSNGSTQIIVPLHVPDDATEPELHLVDVVARVGDVLSGKDRHHAPIRNYSFGDVEVDFASYVASRNGRQLDLSSREFEIIRLLVERRGNVVTREELLRRVWGTNGASLTRTVDVHIAKLRKKIGDPPQNPRYIVTVHRCGYKFIA